MVDRLFDQASQVVEPVAQTGAFPIDNSGAGFRTEEVTRLQIAVRETKPRAGFRHSLLGHRDRCRQVVSKLSGPMKRGDQRFERKGVGGEVLAYVW